MDGYWARFWQFWIAGHIVQYKALRLRENSGDAATHFSFQFKHAEPERAMRRRCSSLDLCKHRMDGWMDSRMD
jgi:hypothetical protein